MARKPKDAGDSSTWMATYADMVSLLLTFFVVMLSVSTAGVEQVDVVIQGLTQDSDTVVVEPGGAVGLLPGVDEVTDMGTLYQSVSAYILTNQLGSEISITRQGDIVFLRFTSQVLFEPDRATILPGSRELLGFVGEVLKMYEDKIRTINIAGHTATTGRTGSGVNDWSLSGERAASVATFFEEVSGFDKRKMITFGYGDNFPFEDNSTEAGRRQNRRVELVVVGIDSMQNFDIYGVLAGVHDGETGGDILTPRSMVGE